MALRQLSRATRSTCLRIQAPRLSVGASRNFHFSAVRRTDGVFKELTSMRVRTPWVEAFRQQQAENEGSSEPSRKSEIPKDRDLTPRHMDESYHSVVLPLAQDPWLLDTYLNSSGHIRLGTIFMDLDALSGIIACKPKQLCERAGCVSTYEQTNIRAMTLQL
jgi:acyl-coenzyme A thioesterase 9